MTAAPGEVPLLDVPDVAEAVRRRWPRLALRAGVALVLPVLVTLYAKALDFYGPVAALGIPLEFLAVGPFAYEAKVIWFVVLLLVGACFLLGEKAPRLVLGLCVGAVLWAGFIYARLHWTKLFLDAWDPLRVEAPSPAAWAYGFLLLALGMAYVLAEALLDAREAQAKRDLPEAPMDALARESARVAGYALGAGLLAAALVGALFWSVRPLLASLPAAANPVFALFALGALLTLGLALAVRRRAALHEE